MDWLFSNDKDSRLSVKDNNKIDRIIELVSQDSLRVAALECVYHLNLPQCYIAAGFIRNLIWDHLHHKVTPTPLNDVDVIYFDPHETGASKHLEYEAKLVHLMPNINWQVRNQASMHTRNKDNPYLDIINAMSYWPENETAIAIRKIDNGHYECVSAFGVESLFNLQITHNPKRHRDVFKDRIKSKNWLNQWPKLTPLPPIEGE